MGSCSVETGAQEAPQPGGPGSAWTGKGPVSNFPDAGQVLSAVLSRTLASPPAHKPPKAPAGLGLAYAEVWDTAASGRSGKMSNMGISKACVVQTAPHASCSVSFRSILCLAQSE